MRFGLSSLLTTCVCTAYTKDVLVVTDRNHEDSYLVIMNHDGKMHDVIARAYMYHDKWFIWYPKKSYRVSVGSFTEALQVIEDDITRCVA